MTAFACTTFVALPWDPGLCRCGAMIEAHDLAPALAMTVAASKAVAETLSKPRGPLLLNLIACPGPSCGVERRFRLRDGALRCESCGLTLDEARAAGPVPSPALIAAQRTAALLGVRLVACQCGVPTTHTGPCNPSQPPSRDVVPADQGAPTEAAAGLPHPTQPEPSPGNLSPSDDAANHPHGAGAGPASDLSCSPAEVSRISPAAGHPRPAERVPLDHKPGLPW